MPKKIKGLKGKRRVAKSIASSKKGKRVQKFLDEMDWLFDISMQQRNIVFKSEDEKEGDRWTMASIEMDDRYQTVTVNIFPEFFKKDLKEQRKILLHELCHIITLPIQMAAENLYAGKLVTGDQIDEATEKTTSKIENLLHHFLIGNLKHFKREYQKYV